MKNINKIKLWFTDFYKGFKPENNSLLDLLNPHFDLEINPENPDFLIYSCHGKEFLNYNCPRIFYTGENLVPDFNLCDYAIGFHHIEFGDRYLRYPNYAFLQDQFNQLIREKTNSPLTLKEKTHFCNFIYANSKANPARDEFFHLLNEYKLVSSPGKHLNNMNFDIGERYSNDWMYTKLDFQSKSKFSIAFENTSSPGYVTEKIMHAFITNTIPIYWGDVEVSRDFNPDAFINCHNFKNFSEVVDYIREVDKNDDLYLKILNAPAFKNNQIPDHLQDRNLIEFFTQIFSTPPEERRKRPQYGTCKNYEKTLKAAFYKPGLLQQIKKKFKF